MKVDKLTIGILAHVDAGKTTLSESILYLTGVTRTQGRVDHKNAFLDHDEIERNRGITVFAKEARFALGEKQAVLLDTPGHGDFSSEAERVLMACRATRRPCGAYLKPTMCRPGSLSTKWTDRKQIAARCLPESERRSVQSLRPLPAACSRTSGDLRSLRHERKLAVPTKPCWRLFSRKNPLRPRSFARQFAPGSCFRFVSAPPSKVRACGNF